MDSQSSDSHHKQQAMVKVVSRKYLSGKNPELKQTVVISTNGELSTVTMTQQELSAFNEQHDCGYPLAQHADDYYSGDD